MIDEKTATRPYESKINKYGDEVMSLEYTNGKWDELNKTMLVFELMLKDTEESKAPRVKKFFLAMRKRIEYLHELMEKKRAKNEFNNKKS